MAGRRTWKATRLRSIFTTCAPSWAAISSKPFGGWAIVWQWSANDADLSQSAIVYLAVCCDGAGLVVCDPVDPALDPRGSRAGARCASRRGGDHGFVADFGATNRAVSRCGA